MSGSRMINLDVDVLLHGPDATLMRSMEGDRVHHDKSSLRESLQRYIVHAPHASKIIGLDHLLAAHPEVASISLDEHEVSTPTLDAWISQISLHFYRNRDDHDSAGIADDQDWLQPDSLEPPDMCPLPNVRFDSDWSELFFDTDLKARLLKHCLTCVDRKSGNKDLANLILLHGPPGTGKTTLARAVAHKLAIRTFDSFSNALLIEPKISVMLDKHVGNSQKNVLRTFDAIQEHWEDRSKLCVVLFDEIESIAGSRLVEMEKGNGDIGRATNALLICLDTILAQPNVIIFCTSNLAATLDRAFVSRVGVMELVDLPSLRARYQILQRCVASMIHDGLILRDTDPTKLSHRGADYEPSIDSRALWLVYKVAINQTTAVPLREGMSRVESTLVPCAQYEEALLDVIGAMPGSTLEVALLAMNTQGLCGRTLRRATRAALMDDATPASEAFARIDKSLRKALRDGR